MRRLGQREPQKGDQRAGHRPEEPPCRRSHKPDDRVHLSLSPYKELNLRQKWNERKLKKKKKKLQTFSTNRTILYLSRVKAKGCWAGKCPSQAGSGARSAPTPGLLGPRAAPFLPTWLGSWMHVTSRPQTPPPAEEPSRVGGKREEKATRLAGAGAAGTSPSPADSRGASAVRPEAPGAPPREARLPFPSGSHSGMKGGTQTASRSGTVTMLLADTGHHPEPCQLRGLLSPADETTRGHTEGRSLTGPCGHTC